MSTLQNPHEMKELMNDRKKQEKTSVEFKKKQ